MKKYLIITAVLLVGWLNIACLNVYYPNTRGEYKHSYDYALNPEQSIMSHAFSLSDLRGDSIAQSKKMNKLKAQTPQYNKYYNDYGVTLVKMGHLAEAEKVFLELEKNQANQYSTASNLGTTYELMGQNEKALYWISEGIKRDSKSHKGSEWIHVKILEAKIALARDPNYLKNHTVLGTDFGKEILPDYKDVPSARNLMDYMHLPKNSPKDTLLRYLYSHLYYQLKERTHFIKKDDPIMGELFFDLGNIAAIIHSFKSATDNYQYVAQYGYKTPISEKRIFYISHFGPTESVRENEKYNFAINPPEKQFEVVKTEEDNTQTYVLLGFTSILSCLMIVALLRSYTNKN
jgi:tetratricopeptide (TPR) repeat protein